MCFVSSGLDAGSPVLTILTILSVPVDLIFWNMKSIFKSIKKKRKKIYRHEYI